MTINELKKMLEEGKITTEQFKAMALALDPDYKDEEDDPDKDKKKTEPDIEKLIQQAVDRATNKIGNDNNGAWLLFTAMLFSFVLLSFLEIGQGMVTSMKETMDKTLALSL